MKVSREQMAVNRQRILDVAGGLFRDRGFDGVSVSDVMKAAGLTHGGFYGHFASKDALIAQTIAHLLSREPASNTDLGRWIEAYLSPAHRDHAGSGCPTAGLAALLRHQTLEARSAMAAGLRTQFDQFSASLVSDIEGGARQTAIASWAAMVGAVILSRAVDDPELADEILDATRAQIQPALGLTL